MFPSLLENNEEVIDKQIEKEFSKNKEDIQEYMNIIKEWAESQQHFPEKPSDKIYRFVVLYNKFSVEKAKKSLDMYYTVRNLMPEMFRYHPLSPEMILQSKVTYCLPMPKMTSDNARIVYIQVNPDYGPDVFDHQKCIIHIKHIVELLVQDDLCYTFHFIFNCDGLKAGHLPKFSPMLLKKASIISEKVYSNRIASIYIVNFYPLVETLVNFIIVPALNPKLRSRVQIYSELDILFKNFGKSLLPKDIGGEERSLEELNDLLLRRFEANKETFDRICSLKADESKRPEKLVNDDILGYYGNFKKVNVD